MTFRERIRRLEEAAARQREQGAARITSVVIELPATEEHPAGAPVLCEWSSPSLPVFEVRVNTEEIPLEP